MFRFILALLLLLQAHASYAEKLSVAVEHYEPFAISQKNGGVGGISADILAEVTKLTGYEFDIRIYPLARIREMMDRGQLDISIAESPLWFDASKLSDFSFSEPYVHVYEYVYFPADKVFSVSKPLDLNGKTVGVHHGYFYAEFEEPFKQGLIKREIANSTEILLKKFIAGRSDVIFLDNFEFGYGIKKLDVSPTKFVRGMRLTDSPVSVMVRNRRKDILEKINPAILRLQTNGTIKKIIEKYVPEQ